MTSGLVSFTPVLLKLPRLFILLPVTNFVTWFCYLYLNLLPSCLIAVVPSKFGALFMLFMLDKCCIMGPGFDKCSHGIAKKPLSGDKCLTLVLVWAVLGRNGALHSSMVGPSPPSHQVGVVQ